MTLLSRIERGSRTSSLKALEQIAQALKVEVKELFDFEGDKKKKVFENKLLKLNLFLMDKKQEEIKLIFVLSKRILRRKRLIFCKMINKNPSPAFTKSGFLQKFLAGA